MDSLTTRRLLVCQYRTCTKDGAAEVLAEFQKQKIANVTVEACGCMGLCGSGPMVVVLSDNTYYCQITAKKAQAIIQTHLINNTHIPSMMHPRLHPLS